MTHASVMREQLAFLEGAQDKLRARIQRRQAGKIRSAVG
jgi:hypothetical protein